MSFKNYDGLLISEIETLEDARRFIEDIRIPIREILEERIAKQVKQMACLIYDLYHVFDIDMFEHTDKERKPLLTATVKLIMEDRDENTEYSIALSQIEGKVLGIPFFPDNRDCYQYLLTRKDVESYGYWDNTDPDPDVSEEEWEERKRVWNLALKEIGIPSHAMFCTVLANTRHMIPDDKYMKNVPSLEEREESCVNHLAMTQASANWKQADGMSAFIKAASELKGEIRKKVKGKLDKKLKIKDLEKAIPHKENNNGSEGVSEASD